MFEYSLAVPEFEIFKMMTQPSLKPGVLRPLPIALVQIVATVQAAVCLALQQYDESDRRCQLEP